MNKILGFDGLRALAAISVVFTHLHIFKWMQESGWVSASIINSINGGAGVQAFFVISGFLITSLLLFEYNQYGKISLYNFYIRRSLRIFPLYYLVVFLVLFFHIIGDSVTNYQSLAFAGVYSYNFIPKAWYSGVLGHTWSLAVEEHFYIIWPFIFISLFYKYKRLMLIVLTSILVSFIMAILIEQIEFFNSNFFIKRWSFIAGANIAFGALLALIFNDVGIGSKAKELFKLNATLAVAFILIFIEVFIEGSNYFVTHYLRGIGFSLLVGWIAINQKSRLARSLEIQPLSYLGKVSYGIYMYQGFFLSTGPGRGVNQTWPLDQSIGIILLILVVPLSYRYFEKPVMDLKYKYQRNKVQKLNQE